MAHDTAESDGMRWLLEAPPPGKVDIHIEVGREATLTPELRQAIEAVMRALPQAEVEGYAKPKPDPGPTCPQRERCSGYRHCSEYTNNPDCASYQTCRIDV